MAAKRAPGKLSFVIGWLRVWRSALEDEEGNVGLTLVLNEKTLKRGRIKRRGGSHCCRTPVRDSS